MASKAKVVVRGAFPAGAKVYLFPRLGDTFAGGDVLQTKTATKLGEVEFSGLEEGKSYWVAAEVDDVWRPRAVVGKVQDDEAKGEPFDPTDPATQRQLRSQREDAVIVSGTRDTKNTRFRGHAKPAEADGFVDKKLGTKDVADEPSATSQGDIVGPLEHAPKGVLLESDTLTGQAIPVRAKLQQQDLPKGVWQESDTPLGDATPLPGELAKAKGKARGPEQEDDNARKVLEQELAQAPEKIKAAAEREAELEEARKGAAFPPPQSDAHGLVPGEARDEGPVEPQEGEPGFFEDDREGDTTLPPLDESRAERREEAAKAEARSKAAKKAARTRKANAKKAPARKSSSGGSSRARKGATTAKKK